MADNRNTLTDEILVLAETLGDIKARFERVESEFAIQSRPLEAALAALSAAMTGIKTLQHHVLDNSLSALSLKVEEQRKAIDDQINVIVSELKGADAQNDEKIALQTAELKQQFAEICANVQQLSSQFDAQIKRVELEAKEQITKFAAVTGPQGPAGASLNPKGNWQEGVFYQRLDVVSLLGTSYVSNVDNNASKPTKNSDKWTVLAARAGNVGGGGAANFGSIAGVAEINQGGTGQTTALAGARALLDGISTTTGDILYRGSSGWTSLTAGAADTVLKSQGSGAAPQWAATSSATAATDAQAAAGTSTTTFVTPANAKYAAAPVVNARAPRQGLVFDGTAGVSVSTPALGTTDFSISFFVRRDSSAVQQYLVGNDNVGCLYVGFRTTGALYSGKTAGSANSDLNIGNVVGKWQHIVLVRSGGNITGYADGVSVGSVTDVGSNYTTGAYSLFQASTGAAALFGAAMSPYIYNRALSASEVVALYESGAPAGADYNSASNTSVVSGANSNFSSDTGYWTKSSATIASGSCTISSGGYILKGGIFLFGKRYRYSITLSSNAGSVFIFNGSSGQVTITGTGTFTGEITTGDSTGSLYIYSSGGTAVLTAFSWYNTGLLLAPDAAQAGGGLTWYDTSGNAANITLPASGVTWNVPTSGNLAGNLQVNGTGNNVFRGPIRWGNTAYPGYNGYITETNTSSQLIPAITRNLIGTTGNTQYTIANAELGAYAAFELGTDIRWFAGTGTFTTGQTITPTERMRLTQGGNLLIGTTTDGGQKLQVAGTAAISSTLTVAGTILSVNTGLFSADATLSSYSTSNGVYLNGHAAGWLRLSGSGGGGAQIQLNGGTGSGATLVFTTNNSTTALTLDGSQNATFAGTVAVQGTAARIYSGTGSPEGSVTAATGSIYLNLSGGNNTTFYVKQSGSGNTGWNAK